MSDSFGGTVWILGLTVVRVECAIFKLPATTVGGITGQVLCYFFSIEMPPGAADAEQEAV
ncbi:hypothetical protein BE61_26210 [Bradyrhizobium elkanii USDA 61]|nr:hypothetical protein [Bradyrhizobium sp. CCBAU 45389]QOZ20041.1 hypothetical protein XI02_37175 [Bradyrhizobium sp. CCBAU 21365]BBB97188.1 hypothetical protein BE61_26210 [Bradyrhizobium elkanii USDA 61]